jgi:hypothetical protein
VLVKTLIGLAVGEFCIFNASQPQGRGIPLSPVGGEKTEALSV